MGQWTHRSESFSSGGTANPLTSQVDVEARTVVLQLWFAGSEEIYTCSLSEQKLPNEIYWLHGFMKKKETSLNSSTEYNHTIAQGHWLRPRTDLTGSDFSYPWAKQRHIIVNTMASPFSLLIFPVSRPISIWAGARLCFMVRVWLLWTELEGISPALIVHRAGFALGHDREIH